MTGLVTIDTTKTGLPLIGLTLVTATAAASSSSSGRPSSRSPNKAVRPAATFAATICRTRGQPKTCAIPFLRHFIMVGI
jgi:hypothetical protein